MSKTKKFNQQTEYTKNLIMKVAPNLYSILITPPSKVNKKIRYMHNKKIYNGLIR